MSVDGEGQDQGAKAASAGPANIRAVLRVATEFLLRSVDSLVRSQDEDLIGGLIFTAVWLANVRHVTLSTANAEFAALDNAVPDKLRRPISVQSVARQLGIPYETVRRYVQRMLATGDCMRIGREGLIVPAAAFAKPRRIAGLQEALPNILRLFSDLKRADFDFSPFHLVLPNTVPLSPGGELPPNTRALMRVGMAMVMDGIELMARLHNGEFLTSLIYNAIWISNVHHITGSDDNLKFGELDNLPPDELRRPVTVNALASSLRLPYETARRYVGKLERSGDALRIEGKGVIVPRAAMLRPDQYDVILETYYGVASHIAEFHRAGFDFRKY